MELLYCLMPVIRGQNGSGSLQATHSMRTRGFACAACLSVLQELPAQMSEKPVGKLMLQLNTITIIKITEAAQ